MERSSSLSFLANDIANNDNGRKRSYMRTSEGAGSSVSDTETEESACSVRRSTRIKKRATNHTFGLDKAVEALEQARDLSVTETLNRQLRDGARRGTSAKADGAPGGPTASIAGTPGGLLEPTRYMEGDVLLLNTSEIRDRATARMQRIFEIAKKSSNLKGDFVRDLKVAARDMAEMVESLADRQSTDETRRLQRDNARMKVRITDLEAQLIELKRDFGVRAPTLPVTVGAEGVSLLKLKELTDELRRDLKGELLLSVGEMMDAKLAGLDDRLLPAPIVRPPLASGVGSNNRRIKGSRLVTSDQASQPETSPGPPLLAVSQEPTGTWASVVAKGKGKGVGKKSSPAASTAAGQASKTISEGLASRTHASTSRVVAPSASLALSASSVPVKRPAVNTKSGKADGDQTSGSVAGAICPSPVQGCKTVENGPRVRNPVKLTLPSSAAVVVTLREEALKRGETYGSVLAKAKQTIKLPDLGISQIKLRKTATGARIFEISGSERGAKADQLAGRLREAISEAARVDRPEKSADLLIKDLEDSVAIGELIAALADKGGCAVEHIKPGTLRVGSNGLGTMFVQCPVAAAKRIAQGRMLIGLSSPRIEVVEGRPLRCFRCLALGHTRATCTSEFERCNLCFRCGEAGHVASACRAKVNCIACAAANKPAGHKMGGRACKAPPVRKKEDSTVTASTSATGGTPPAAGESPMSARGSTPGGTDDMSS